MSTCDRTSTPFSLRPISPYGFAPKTEAANGLRDGKSFSISISGGYPYILEINRSGYRLAQSLQSDTPFQNPHPTRNRLHVHLQLPAGRLECPCLQLQRDIFASDEARMLAEMQDWTFRSGNVHRTTAGAYSLTYAALRMFEASCNQSLAGCF